MTASQGVELHRHVPRQARPVRLVVQELLPGQGEDEKGRVREPDDKRADKFEQALIRPLQILENQQRRLLARQRLEETPHRGEQVLSLLDSVVGEPRDDR